MEGSELPASFPVVTLILMSLVSASIGLKIPTTTGVLCANEAVTLQSEAVSFHSQSVKSLSKPIWVFALSWRSGLRTSYLIDIYMVSGVGKRDGLLCGRASCLYQASRCSHQQLFAFQYQRWRRDVGGQP